MTYFKLNFTVLLTTSLLALAACDLEDKNIGDGGTETGDGDGDGDTNQETGDGDGPGACGEETVTILDDLDAAPTTFELSTNQIIADAAGDYTGTYTWLENDGPVMVAHAGTSADLTMSVVYDGGQVRLTEVEDHGDFPGGQAGGFPCSNSIEIDAVLEFTTSDGLYAESIAVVLDAQSIDYAGPSLYHNLDMDSHQGSLALDDFSFTDSIVQALILGASFGGEGVTGYLGMEVLNEELGFVGFGSVANFSALLDGANSLCGACAPDHYCEIFESFEPPGGTTYTCMDLPGACIDDPTCACLSSEVCPDFQNQCIDGDEVSTVSCSGV